MDDRITQDYLRDCFDYENGKLYWKHRPATHFIDVWRQRIFNARFLGKEAGTIVSGYLMVNFSSKRLSVHRLVFLLHHGYLPSVVDHINGNPLDNRIENLREATHSKNLQNMKTPSSNTSGRKGVSWNKKSWRWIAYIRADGKLKHLGSFKDISDAIRCRESAENIFYGEFANER